jgi:filamin
LYRYTWVELQFSRGQYVGSYRWTQPGLHTVSISLDQEAVVGSPFTVEALAALPEIRELETMSTGEVNAILVKLTPDAASQALAALPPEQAAESLVGHSPDSVARMMNGMYPSAVSQVLTALPGNAAAAALGAMSESKTREILAAMPASDTGKLMASMPADDLVAKADVLADTLAGMREEEAAEALTAMVAAAGDSCEGVAAVLNKMPTKQVASMVDAMSPADATAMLSGMRHDEAAAVIEAMPPAKQVALLHEMGDAAVYNLTSGLGAAYQDDRRLPAAERAKQRDAAVERARRMAPALAQLPPAKLAQSMKNADASHVAGTLFALVHEPAGSYLQTSQQQQQQQTTTTTTVTETYHETRGGASRQQETRGGAPLPWRGRRRPAGPPPRSSCASCPATRSAPRCPSSWPTVPRARLAPSLWGCTSSIQ